MKLLTLTPETEAFAIAAIAVYALSSAQVTAQLQMWWPRGRAPSFLKLYVVVMAAVALAALAVLDLPTVTEGPPFALALALPLGAAAGVAAVRFDALTRRRARRRARQTLRWVPAGSAMPGPRSVGALRNDGIPALALLVAVAALEEVLFRGVLVDLSRALPHPALVGAAIVGTLAVFTLSHIHWGWHEVLSKAVLGLLALVLVLILGTVVPAIVAHALFNARAWLAARADAGSSGRGDSAVRAATSAAQLR